MDHSNTFKLGGSSCHKTLFVLHVAMSYHVVCGGHTLYRTRGSWKGIHVFASRNV